MEFIGNASMLEVAEEYIQINYLMISINSSKNTQIEIFQNSHTS